MQLLQSGESFFCDHADYPGTQSSDEETEVEVVKKALLEHIDMDPPRALQVLCDQCIFDSGILDEEERAMRGRLRTLVIQFLARDAKRRVARQPNEKAEEILFTGLVNVGFIHYLVIMSELNHFLGDSEVHRR